MLQIFCLKWSLITNLVTIIEYIISHIRSDTTLPSGEWNTNGCVLISQEGSTLTCQCDHLTHFAILFSPGVPVCQSVCLSVYINVCCIPSHKLP